MKAKEANILSFRVLFDGKGQLVTEVGGLPIEDANKVFKGTDLKIIQTVIREGRQRIYDIHRDIENELERVFAEIDWIASKKIQYILNADSDFGMHSRDINIAIVGAVSSGKTTLSNALCAFTNENMKLLRNTTISFKNLFFNS